MEKAEEIQIQDSQTIFEVILVCLRNSFYSDQIKNLGLLANNNELLKKFIEHGEPNYGYDRIENFFK